MSLFEENSVIVEATKPVAKVLLNRREYQNVINNDLLQNIIDAFDNLAGQEGVRAVLFGSTESGVFSLGLDVRFLEGLGLPAATEFFGRARRAVEVIENFPCPVIAVVEGHAIGAGLEIALACDIVLASSEAHFGQPEANFGMLPAMGGVRGIRKRCSRGASASLLFAAEIIDADEAFRIGLVDRVFPKGDLVTAATKLAEEISMRAPRAIRSAKTMLRRFDERTKESWQAELEMLQDIYSTHDREEGMQAFLRKVEPEFKDR